MRLRSGVSTAAFAGTVIVLLAVAGAGFGLYLTKPAAAQSAGGSTTEEMMQTTSEAMSHMSTEVMTHSSEAMMGGANMSTALAFTRSPGQAFGGAWLLVEPTGTGQYALSIHAVGLENTQGTGSSYIVEATQSSGAMAMGPIGTNATASEFQTGADGVGNFFTLLSQNPYTSFEGIQILYLRGMAMSNATTVATVSFPMAPH
jgi:hypothetical protein